MSGIEIKGLNEKLAQLEKLGRFEEGTAALWAAGEHLKAKLDEYPPETAANQPHPSVQSGRVVTRWYERGYGPKWQNKDGSVNGRQTSETLGRKWTVARRDGGRTVVVGNNVSYAPFVHDPSEQAFWHKAHGWKTTDDVVNQERERIVGFVEERLNRLIEQG